jgi:sialic acid synthase SpsE
MSASRIHYIAEAGTNHNADPATALALVEAAAAAGADSVKFQIIHPEGLYLTEFYRDGTYVPNEVVALRRAGMLPDEAWAAVDSRCRELSLPWSASVFDRRGLDLLESFDPPYVKIASCDLNNYPFLRLVAERGRRMIVSTGMASLGEIERAVAAITATGNTDIVLLHCVSVYPCPTRGMNLAFLSVLKAAFGFPVGLSDHTEASLAAAMAVAMGTQWIEKHFTLDRSSKGFDHAYAMNPEGLAAHIRDVRDCEAALARPGAKVSAPESEVRTRARRGLYAARDIVPGETVRPEDVLVVRPEGPLAPGDLEAVVGRVAEVQVKRCEPLRLTQFR